MGQRSRARRTRPEVAALPVIGPQVAGVDIGSTEHWVCGPAGADGRPTVRAFGTTAAALTALVDWLGEQGVESAAMESTSVYGIPLYELLEARGIEPVRVNARQLHNVPGRKTDVQDCQWLQLLHSCGLLRGSFRPGDAVVRLRALGRQLANLVAERTRCVQWMQKALDQMNVQIHRAVTDLTGTTGLAIVRAIVAGERDPAQLATLRDPRCRKSEAEIAAHLTGTWRDEHLFNLASALQLFDALTEMVASYEARLTEELAALTPPDEPEAPAPPHPNPTKQQAITVGGDEQTRTILWRVAGVDLTRIDGINVGSAQFSLQRSKTALGAAFRRLARRKDRAVAVFATARKLAQLV